MTNFKAAALFAVFGFLFASHADSSRAATDNTLGMAIVFAFVGSDGTLLNGSGATGATSPGTGAYRVSFDRDVSNCAKTATVYGVIGRTAVVMPSDDPATIIVATSTGTSLASHPFYLLVYCHR